MIRAAGGETLEAWAERELAPAGAAHRAWIAEIIAGRDAPKPKVGRATGAVTAIGGDALAALGLQPLGGPSASAADPPRPVADAHAKTVLPVSDDIDDIPARRRGWVIALPIIAVVMLASVIVGILAIREADRPAIDAGSVSADAEVIDAIAIDATVDAAIAIDAPAIDMARPCRVVRGAPR